MTALDTFTSQSTFRVLLDALAHPGRVGALPAEASAGAPAALAVPRALAALGQTVAVVGVEGSRWEAHISADTSCSIAAASDADQVVVLDGATAELVASLRRGTSLAPEQGCRLVLACADVGRGPVALTIAGPGVPGRRRLALDGIDPDVLRALAEVNTAFPAGVDTFLVTPGGEIAGLPRSSSLEVG